jgi:hypothetical protein
MSQKQDLLFCKIAIANGRVSEDQAKKCLAIANKREQETGRRPTIGSVFSKYNLMGKQEVKFVYEAVYKRTGMPVPMAGAPAAGGGRGGKTRKPSFADEARQRRVDPNVLWLGVAFGVIFLGIVVALVVMFVTHSGPDKPGEDGAPAIAAPAGAAGTPAGTAAGGAGAPAGAAAGGAPGTAPAAPAGMREDHRRLIRQRLTDARHASLTDATKALGMLNTLKSTIDDKKIVVDPGLMNELNSEIKHLKAGDSGSDDEGPDDAGPDSALDDL